MKEQAIKTSNIKKISNWNELASIECESSSHVLEVDIKNGNCWLRAKKKRKYKKEDEFYSQAKYLSHYFTPDIFDKSMHEHATKLLQICGFQVEIIGE